MNRGNWWQDGEREWPPEDLDYPAPPRCLNHQAVENGFKTSWCKTCKIKMYFKDWKWVAEGEENERG